MMSSWVFGVGLAVAEWAAAFGLSSLVLAMIEARVEFWQGAAVCVVMAVLWSAVGGAVQSWAVRCR